MPEVCYNEPQLREEEGWGSYLLRTPKQANRQGDRGSSKWSICSLCAVSCNVHLSVNVHLRTDPKQK